MAPNIFSGDWRPKTPVGFQRLVFAGHLTCCAFLVGACIELHWGSYRGGYSSGDDKQWAVDGFILLPLGALLVLCCIVTTSLVTVLCRRGSLFALIPALGAFAALAVSINARFDPPLFLRGFRDGVANRVTLDDLRQLRRVLVITRPVGEKYDFHEAQRPWDNSEHKWLLTVTPESRWESICSQTKIERLIGRMRVYVDTVGDIAILTWGGALPGHWGIRIGPGRIEYQGAISTIRLADDIVLFHNN